MLSQKKDRERYACPGLPHRAAATYFYTFTFKPAV
jgi:hypothetical protein